MLRFATSLAQGAVSAYLRAAPVLDNRGLANAAGSIPGGEAMHCATLRTA